MKNKLIGLISKNPIFSVTLSVAILVSAVGIAALLGVFGSKDSKDDVSPAASLDVQSNNMSFADTSLKITALESDNLGVNPSSKFKLLFDSNAPNEKELSESLSVKPEQAFQLKKVSANEYSMEFEKPLQKDSIYRFILGDKSTGAEQSWAFQTKKSLNVTRTLPRGKSVQVPVNTGIEITFSHENIENADKYFEISPKTNGRFELHKKTLVFVPDKLTTGTIYTVTVKKGIGVKGSSDILENDFTFSFQTEIPQSNSNSRTYFSFSDTLFSFTPQAPLALQVYADEKLTDKEVSVEVYTYRDADSFLNNLKSAGSTPSWAVSQSSDTPYDELKLERIETSKARIVSNQNTYWYTTYLLLPSQLPEGYYLAKVEIDGEKYYTQFQVNAASVYILTTKEKSLAWLNDSVTGMPLAGAELKMDTGTAVKADKDGMAVLNEILPSASDVSSLYFTVNASGKLPFIAQVKSNLYQPYYSCCYDPDIASNYWRYIYLDKGIYLPEDTVNIWGVIKPRDGISTETEAVLELVRYDYSVSGDNNVSVLTSQKVKISPNGTFTGSLRLSNYNPGSYDVRLSLGGKTLLSNYLQIMDYTKPTYKIDITQDRNFMYAWEKVNYNIQASFFEGTPASGINLIYDGNVGGHTLESNFLISNAAGEAKVTLSPNTSEEGWRPLTLFFNVSNKDAEEEQISAHSYVNVFPKDTMIEVHDSTEGEKGISTITTSRIDISKLNNTPYDYYNEDAYRGSSVDMHLTAKLYEKHYEKKETGEYYDYINKVKQKKYEYYEVQNLIKEYSFDTVNGNYELNYKAEKDMSYYLEIFGNDSRGRVIKETQYLYNWYYYPTNFSTYSIAENSMNKQFKQDENVSVEIKYNKETPFTGSNRKYLFIRLKNGVLDYNLTESPVFDFKYSKELIPNMYVKAVCFDGSNIYDAGIRQYIFDRTEKQLEVKVQADKESYKPGETVKLSLEVLDTQGQPCSSEINLSIVDEAYFAVAEQSVDTLSALYSRVVSSGMLADYFSYTPTDKEGYPMAEGGEGGDMYVRKDFKDSALFTSVTSDLNGKAEASFKLPDNLTSWRITCQAVTEDLKAGNSKLNISSKLPFFLDTIFNKAFITGDRPAILVRAYGTELPADAAVDYKITVTSDNGVAKAYTAKGIANITSEIPLDSLAAGSYTIRAEAVSNSLKDALERSFKVSDSLLETARTDYINLSDSTVISNNSKGLTSLVFYGEDSHLLYNELQALYWSWGNRLDQKLARSVSGKLLHKYFNEDIYDNGDDFNINEYQTDDGGLALLTYDSSNPALSAKLCSLAEADVDNMALASYFRKLLEDSTTTAEDIAFAYWGLAALKEPVLLDIRNLLDSTDLTPQIKLVLGVALADIGDFEGARNIYNEHLKKYGVVTDTLAYLEIGTRDDSVDATALCSLIGLKINASEKIKLFNYIKSNSTSELLVNIERMIFVKNYINEASLSSGFNYELDGVKKQVDLQKGSYFKLTLSPEKLSSIKFNNIKGKVVVSTSYVSPVNELLTAEDSPVTLKRTYSAVKGTADSFDRSDSITVTLTPVFSETAPDGFYEITDVLPAGFRFLRSGFSNGSSSWYPDEVTGQKVIFGYYYNKNSCKKDSIIYHAMAVMPGTYTADNAAICHTESNITGFCNKAAISINK